MREHGDIIHVNRVTQISALSHANVHKTNWERVTQNIMAVRVGWLARKGVTERGRWREGSWDSVRLVRALGMLWFIRAQ